MKRAPLGSDAYWDGRVKKFSERIAADKSNMGFPSKNPGSEPNYWFNHARYSFRLIMLRYSRGDAVDTLLRDSFQDLLDSWTHSNIRTQAPQARVVKVADSGHFIPEEQPERLLQYLVEFLQ